MRPSLEIEAINLLPAVDILWLPSCVETASDIYARNYAQVTAHHAIIHLPFNAVILATTISAAILWVLRHHTDGLYMCITFKLKQMAALPFAFLWVVNNESHISSFQLF